VRTRPDLPAPDLELPFAAVLYEREWETPPTEHGFTIGAVALQPRSRGTVTLASCDPLAPPLIDPRLVSDPADLEVLVHGVRLARRIAAAPALREWNGGELTPGTAATSEDDLRDFVRAHAHTIYHPVGTCMGTDAGTVVDPALRVRGVDGLRVVDASVMPTIPRGHTMAATVMIAEKGADLVRAD
jgi:choline dehydrogenase